MKWDEGSGIIPAVWGEKRSPYQLSIADFVRNFAITPHRRTLAHGFLEYRARLREYVGKEAIQWIDGSYTENIEGLERRSPKDIDVVTIAPFSSFHDLDALREEKLYDRGKTRKSFGVDAFLLPLGRYAFTTDIRLLTYWYAQWSHRRDGLWKGFIQVFLHDDEEEEARRILRAW